MFLLQKWRLAKFSAIFPLSVVWEEETFQTKTLLNIASFCNALDSVRLLIGNDLSILPEEEMRNSIQCIFMSCNENINSKLSRDQFSLLLLLLGRDNSGDGIIHDSDFDEKRQRVLDRLLLLLLLFALKPRTQMGMYSWSDSFVFG